MLEGDQCVGAGKLRDLQGVDKSRQCGLQKMFLGRTLVSEILRKVGVRIYFEEFKQ